jgi:hypothetical protein
VTAVQGFLLNSTHLGKGTNYGEGESLGEKVVISLLTDFENKDHIVYCDSFFSSSALFLNLRRKGIGACDTVRANRKGLPAEMKPQVCKMKRGGENQNSG